MEQEKEGAAAVRISGGEVTAEAIAGRDVHIHRGIEKGEGLPRFRSNVQPHRNQLIGRNELLRQIIEQLGSTSQNNILVLHGPPGVGKSELAREVARRQQGHYSGGTFEIN